LRHRDKMKLFDLFNHCYMSYIYYILIYIAQNYNRNFFQKWDSNPRLKNLSATKRPQGSASPFNNNVIQSR